MRRVYGCTLIYKVHSYSNHYIHCSRNASITQTMPSNTARAQRTCGVLASLLLSSPLASIRFRFTAFHVHFITFLILQAPSWFATTTLIVNEPPPRLRTEDGHSPELCDLVAQCLNKEASKRPNYEQLLVRTFAKVTRTKRSMQRTTNSSKSTWKCATTAMDVVRSPTGSLC